MKRRDFIRASAGLIGGALPGLALAQSKPCPPPSIAVGGGTTAATACPSDATGDWIARASGRGVVWAHDFSEPGEVSSWRYDSGAASPPAASSFDVYAGPAVIGNSRPLVSKIVASTLASGITASSTAWQLTNASEFPDPAAVGPYLVLTGTHSWSGTQESARVTAKSGNTLTVTRGIQGAPAGWPAGTGVSFGQRTSWLRPLGAFTSAVNGKSSSDIGIANGFKSRDADWRGSHYRFRGAYWGHSSYQTLYHPLWPVSGYDSYSSSNGWSYTNTFDGTEFWLQFRMRISASRFLQTTANKVPGKLFYLQTASGSTGQQIYFKVNPPSKNFAMETNYGTEIVNTSAWQYTTDEWVTYLLHLKPGRNGVAETTLEVFAARPGATSYTTVFSSTALALSYSMPAPDEANPPAYNSFGPLNYANHYVGSGSVGPSTSTHSVEYTQIILSREWIACPTA